MKIPKVYIKETSFAQLAKDVDDMPMNETILFTTEGPDIYKDLLGLDSPTLCHIVSKVRFDCQHNINNYCVGIWQFGERIEIKSIDILTNDMCDDQEARQNGIEKFLKEWCDKYCDEEFYNNKVYYYYELDEKIAIAMEEYFKEV